MQDIYAFDVGDFGKFGLLGHLMAGAPSLNLGVFWYATNLGTASADGKHLSYLGDDESQLTPRVRLFSDCDAEMFSAFRRAVSGSRSIASLERLGLLPRDRTGFWSTPVGAAEDREKWFAEGGDAVRNCDVVFCDPDNGIAKPESRLETTKSQRHVLLNELKALSDVGHGLVVYHHLGRQPGGHEAEIGTWLVRLREALRTDVVAARFRRGTSRAFFVAKGSRAPTLCERLASLAGTPWVRHRHMELYVPGIGYA